MICQWPWLYRFVREWLAIFCLDRSHCFLALFKSFFVLYNHRYSRFCYIEVKVSFICGRWHFCQAHMPHEAYSLRGIASGINLFDAYSSFSQIKQRLPESVNKTSTIYPSFTSTHVRIDRDTHKVERYRFAWLKGLNILGTQILRKGLFFQNLLDLFRSEW